MASIYAASLADYNDGTLHGEWFDLDDFANAEDLNAAIEAMLARSPLAGTIYGPAEEFAIHDYEGFGDYEIREYASLEFVMDLHDLIERHGGAFAVFLRWEQHGESLPSEYEASFEDRYVGEITLREYAEEDLDEQLREAGVPESLQPFFDVDRYARDLGHEFTEHKTEDGNVFLFRDS